MTPTPNDPVVISMGSNLNPERNLKAAMRRLRERFPVIAVSRVFRTPPVGSPGAPPFLNVAVRIVTRLEPLDLKHQELRPIEEELGRERSSDVNAPRTLDLDLTLYGDRVVEDPDRGLMLPDPELLTRAHVALPVADIEPKFVHPVDGRSIEEIAASLGFLPEIELVGTLDLGAGG